MKINLLDILLAIPLLYLVFKGWRRGLVREVATLAGLLVGVWASVHLSPQVAEWLDIGGENTVLIAFIVTFIGALVLTYLLGRSIEGLMKAVKLNLANHIAGALLGLCKALCILAILLNYLVMIDSREVVLKPQVKQQSLLYSPVYHIGNRLTLSLKQYIAQNKERWKEVAK